MASGENVDGDSDGSFKCANDTSSSDDSDEGDTEVEDSTAESDQSNMSDGHAAAQRERRDRRRKQKREQKRARKMAEAQVKLDMMSKMNDVCLLSYEILSMFRYVCSDTEPLRRAATTEKSLLPVIDGMDTKFVCLRYIPKMIQIIALTNTLSIAFQPRDQLLQYRNIRLRDIHATHDYNIR